MRYLIMLLCLLMAGVAGANTFGTKLGGPAVGTPPVDFPQFRSPSGEGPFTGWTPVGDVENWMTVDDPIGNPDEDVTYVYKLDTSGSDSFVYPAFTVEQGQTITSLVIHNRCRNAAPGETSVRNRIYVNGTLYFGDDRIVTDSYAEYTNVWTTNPETTEAWTVDDINGVGAVPLQEILVDPRGMNTGEEIRCTQVYFEVN